MSSDISRIGAPGYLPLQTDATSAPGSGSAASNPTPVTPDDDAVSVELSGGQSGLPSEVSAAISTASGAYERLAGAGQHVHFSTDPQSGSVSAELQDADGTTTPLSLTDVLNLASGGSLE